MSTFKKLFASVAAVMVVASTVPANVFAASYSNEQQDAYDYAFGAGLTTQATIDGARLNDSITRAELAKVASVAAEAQGLSLDTSASCSFNDTASLQGSDLLSYVTKACQYGLMGVNTNGVFNPAGLVTRAELAAVIDRILNGDANVGGNPWYAGHMASLQDAGIMNDISNPSSLALRFHAFVMFQRADEGGTTPAVCQDPMVQLSCALGLDDCPAECSGDEEEEEEEEPTFTGEGTLSVELSSDTPEGGKVPANVDGLVIATFDLTASDDADVRVDSITLDRLGYSDSDTIQDYALVSKSAGRISKIKGDNSEGEVALSIQGGLIVKAGETEAIDVVVSLGASAAAGDTFYVEVTEVSSTAEDANIESDNSEEFEVGSQDAPVLSIDDGSSVGDNLKVGQSNATVARFELENEGTNNSDEQEVTIYSLTFENVATGNALDTEEHLSDFKLYIDGDLFAEADSAFGDYVTLTNEDGFVLEDGDSVQGEMKATINGEVSKTIEFVVSEDLDIVAVGEKYGFGADVDVSAYAGSSLTIGAGDVVISGEDPEFDELRDDRDDVVLGKFIINVTEGDDLELDQIVFNNTTVTTSGLTSYFENVELYNETRGGKIDLDIDDGNDQFESDNEEDIALNMGKNVFRLQADVLDVDATWSTQTFKFNVTESELVITETQDDTQVTDVTPSIVTYSSFDGTDSDVEVTAINLSDLDVVVGSEGLVAMTFDVEAQGGSAIDLEEIKMGVVDSSGALSPEDFVSEIALYKGSVSDDNLLDSQGGDDFDGSNEVTFDNFDEISIANDSKQRFVVTVSFNDDDALDGEALSVYVAQNGVRSRDDNNDLVLAPTAGDITSPRTFDLNNGGSFSVSLDLSDASADSDRYVVAGETSLYIAALDLVAQDEAADVKSFDVYATGTDVASFDEVVSAVELYNAAGTLVRSENTVDGQAYVTFDNLNAEVAASTTTWYIKVVTNNVGYQENSAFGAEDIQLYAANWEVWGASSNEEYVGIADTAESHSFGVVPVKPTELAFVANGGGESVDSNISEGVSLVGILKIKADENTNKWSTNNTDAKMLLSGLTLTMLTGGVNVTDLTIENASDGNQTSATLNGNVATFSLAGTDYYVQPGTTEYFVIRATLSGVNAGNDSFQLKLDGLNNGVIEFTTDETSADSFNGARMDLNTATSTKLFGNSN